MARILITGTRGGIGLDTAQRLLTLGHTVYATVHHQESVKHVQKVLAEFGDLAIVEKLDVLQADDRDKALKWKIDVLINNAAIGNSGPLAEIPVEKLKEVFETNVFAVIALSQVCIPYMKDKGEGKIIFLSSLVGLMPAYYLAAYSMTKFTIENVGLTFRQELKPFGIGVALINPGAYHTGFNQKNFAQKESWFNQQGLYKEHLDKVYGVEKEISRFEQKNTASIAKQIVKAVTAKKMKRRYAAPFYQWFFVSLAKRFLI